MQSGRRRWWSRFVDDKDAPGSDLTAWLLAISANIVAGSVILVDPDGQILKTLAVGLVVVGAISSASLGHVLTRRLATQPRVNEATAEVPESRLGTVVSDTSPASSIERRSRAGERRGAERPAVQNHTRVLDLSGHAAIFYIALLVGCVGLAVCAIGYGHDVYSATLSGSFVASLGFVTVACVLVSAEQADTSA